MLVEQERSRGGKRFAAILWDSVGEPAAATASRDWSLQENGRMATTFATGKGPDNGSKQGWLGAPSAKVLFSRLSQGWPEGAARLADVSVPDVEAQSVRRRRERADQGDSLDIQSVYRGDLSRAWERTRRRSTNTGREISIIIDLAGHCGLDASQLEWRGIAALRLAQSLTEAGHSVAIYGAAGCVDVDEGRKVDCAQFVAIKDADQPLDIDRLAALTVMPGFFRTALFAGIVFATDLCGGEASSWLGRPSAEMIGRAVPLLPIPQRAIIQDSDVLSREKANEWVAEAVAAADSGEV